MKDELTIRDIAMYFPDVEFQVTYLDPEHSGESPIIDKVESISGECITFKKSPDWYFDGDNNDTEIKILVRPLSDLTKEIEVDGERFVPIEWFEIGDGDNESPEYSHGNIKVIRDLKAIAKYNHHHDIQYLPFGVVQKLIEWKLDIKNLIGRGLAIDLNTVK